MHIKIENQLNILNLNKFSLKGDHYSEFTPCKTHECVPLAQSLTVTLFTYWILIHFQKYSFSYFSCTLHDEWINGGFTILMILRQGHIGLHPPERSVGQQRSVGPSMFSKVRERSGGHIPNLEVVKLCLSWLRKMFLFWYCSCLGHLWGEREVVPSLEWKGEVGKDGCGEDFMPMVPRSPKLYPNFFWRRRCCSMDSWSRTSLKIFSAKF